MSWLKRLFGGGAPEARPAPSEPPSPTVDEINRLLPAFGQLMEANASFVGAVFDERMLPAPKSRLEYVLFCAIGITDDDAQARQVAAALIHLADYQPNVGPVPVTQLPSLPDPSLLTTPEAIRAAAVAVSTHAQHSTYSEFQGRVRDDLLRLKNLAEKALAVRATRLRQRRAR